MTKKKKSQKPADVVDPSAALETMKTLQLEIRRLRSLAKEISAAYIPKLESRAEEISERLKEAVSLDVSDLRVMLAKIRDLSVKPNKGRRKDLRKLEELLDSLEEDADDVVERSEKIAPRERDGAGHEKKRRHHRAGKG